MGFTDYRGAWLAAAHPGNLPGSSPKLINLSRGSAVIEIDGHRYDVNGEGYSGGTWGIFSKMVYQENASGKWELIVAGNRRRLIIAELHKQWPANPGGWPVLRILEEKDDN